MENPTIDNMSSEPIGPIEELLSTANDYRIFCEVVAETKLDSVNESVVAQAEKLQAILSLRQERLRRGFILLPLPEYIESLAARASVLLEKIYSDYGISTHNSVSLESARAFAKLAFQIGIDAKETMLMARMAFAQQNSLSPAPPHIAFRTDKVNDVSPKVKYGEHLSSMESNYSEALSQELSDILLSFRDEYFVRLNAAQIK